VPHRTPQLTKQQIGALGERIVADALGQRGFETLARNVRTRFGEVDLVARRGSTVFFVEVKTRTSRSFGYPEEAVDARKRLHLSRCALVLAGRFAPGADWAILVVAVELDVDNATARLRRVEVDG
jgi:putative endonuclease